MNKIVFLLGLLSLPLFAGQAIDKQLQDKTLVCSGQAQYVPIKLNLNFGFTERKDGYLGSQEKDETLTLIWSSTQCEDEMALHLQTNDLEKLLQGTKNALSATFVHNEPDLDLRMGVTCQFIKYGGVF